MGIDIRIERMEREALVRLIDWLQHLRLQGVHRERIALALGMPGLMVMRSANDEWHREGSVLPRVWSMMADTLEVMDGEEILRWAEDVETGEQLDCVGKIRVMRGVEGGNDADALLGLGVIDKIRAIREEALVLADLDAAYIERDAERYAARLAESVRRVDKNEGDNEVGD